jgi:hypothetical protein
VVFAADYTISTSGNPPVSGAGRRMMWYVDKAAFRAGAVAGDIWDKDSIGLYSFATGIDSKAKGIASFSMGIGTQAIGQGASAFGSSANAQGTYSIAAGLQSIARGSNSFAMGYLSEANGDYSMAFGYRPFASGENSLALGNFASAGDANTIAIGAASAGNVNAVAIGHNAVSFGSSSTAIGDQNVASGNFSFSSGYHNHANGDYSTTLGSYAYTNFHTGSFVISGRTDGAIVTSSADHQMMMDFAGGYILWSGPSGQGVHLDPNQNSWAASSDYRLKENFLAVDGEDFLTKIAALKLTSWNYKKTDPLKYRHYGPMAQDFYHAFGRDAIGVIGNDTTINQQDFLGVNLIAIQALEKRTRQISEQQQEIDALKKEIAELKKLILSNQ